MTRQPQGDQALLIDTCVCEESSGSPQKMAFLNLSPDPQVQFNERFLEHGSGSPGTALSKKSWSGSARSAAARAAHFESRGYCGEKHPGPKSQKTCKPLNLRDAVPTVGVGKVTNIIPLLSLYHFTVITSV